MRLRTARALAAFFAAGMGWWAGALVALDGLAPVAAVVSTLAVTAAMTPGFDVGRTTLPLVALSWVLFAAAMAGLLVLAVMPFLAPFFVDAIELRCGRLGLRRIAQAPDRALRDQPRDRSPS